MGLAVETGLLAELISQDPESAEGLRKTFAKINKVLAENDLPPHNEPEELPALESRAGILGYPYSYLHHLRRAYAHTADDPDWVATPTPSGEDPSEDPVVEEEMDMLSSHLLCHSDCEGFYLPIDFEELIIDRGKRNRIPGGLLGSSYRLMEELVEVAPKLGIKLKKGKLSDAEAARVNKEARSDKGLWIEKTVWISLFEAARLSIEHKTAIYFV